MRPPRLYTAGQHRVTIPAQARRMQNKLITPVLPATKPGAIRPGIAPAFKIGIIYAAVLVDIIGGECTLRANN